MNFLKSTQDTVTPATERGDVSPQRARRMTKIVAIAVVAVLAALYGFHLVRQQLIVAYLASHKPPPMPVSTEVVIPTTVPQFLTAVGSISAVHQVTIAPEVAGRVTDIKFDAGTTAVKGDLLVRLNDAPERAQLEAMRAEQRLARVALDRTRQLRKQGHVAQSRLDQAQSQYDAAAANTARAEADVAQRSIYAPFDGILGIREVEVGQYLHPGDKITSLTETSPLYITFSVPEQDLPRIRIGQNVSLTVDAYPGRDFAAKVVVIDPQVMSDTRTARVQALADNPDNLLSSGMFADVKVAMPPAKGVLTVPETAVSYSMHGSSLFVVQSTVDEELAEETGHIVKSVPVKIIDRFDGRVTVDGLQPGDRVITLGQNRVFEGAPVVLGDEEPPEMPDQLPLN